MRATVPPGTQGAGQAALVVMSGIVRNLRDDVEILWGEAVAQAIYVQRSVWSPARACLLRAAAESVSEAH